MIRTRQLQIERDWRQAPGWLSTLEPWDVLQLWQLASAEHRQREDQGGARRTRR